jgi:hypothetical protein
MRLDIMDMRERIYNAYKVDAGKVSSFCNKYLSLRFKSK